MSFDSRRARLLIEHEKLINLAGRSDFIKIDPIEVQPGMPPEKYLVTFTCKGIAAINEKREPRIAEFHQVSIYLSRDFPRHEPYMKWMTPIWHPNIEHEEPNSVCTNNVVNNYATKGIDDLVMELGNMVQYKWYHAKWEPPWPLDRKVAEWVVDYAEPKGIVGPEKPLDPRPLLRQYKIRRGGKNGTKKSTQPSAEPKPKKQTMRLGERRDTGSLSPPVAPPLSAAAPAPAVPVRKPGIKLGEKRG